MLNILTIDTNIWAYYFDEDAPEHKHVEKSVDKVIKSSEQILVNTVIVMELSHFLIKNLGPIQGAEKLSLFLSYPLVIDDLNYEGVLDSIEELKRYSHLGIGGRDATILSSMRRASSDRILTHDSAFKKIDWLSVVDPIP